MHMRICHLEEVSIVAPLASWEGQRWRGLCPGVHRLRQPCVSSRQAAQRPSPADHAAGPQPSGSPPRGWPPSPSPRGAPCLPSPGMRLARRLAPPGSPRSPRCPPAQAAQRPPHVLPTLSRAPLRRGRTTGGGPVVGARAHAAALLPPGRPAAPSPAAGPPWGPAGPGAGLCRPSHDRQSVGGASLDVSPTPRGRSAAQAPAPVLSLPALCGPPGAAPWAALPGQSTNEGGQGMRRGRRGEPGPASWMALAQDRAPPCKARQPPQTMRARRGYGRSWPTGSPEAQPVATLCSAMPAMLLANSHQADARPTP
jgi:hypothetical protein